MVTIAGQVRGTLAVAEEKDHCRFVSLRGVADTAGKDQIVTSIISGLAAAWSHMVQRDAFRSDFGAAVCADGTVAFQKPESRVGVSCPAGWERRA